MLAALSAIEKFSGSSEKCVCVCEPDEFPVQSHQILNGHNRNKGQRLVPLALEELTHFHNT